MSDGGFNFGGRAKREPNADIRRWATALHEFYTGNVDEGFDKKQAMALTVVFLQETLRSGTGQGDG